MLAPKPFNLKAPFEPGGDQPKAIEQLVENVKIGARNQVLLGATGTGKSVAWNELVTVRLSNGKHYRGPIGTFIDRVIGETQEDESVEMPPNGAWKIFSWDAASGKTAWRSITGLSRHTSPDKLYKLKTACGRSVTVTGDHSVWVLRDGNLQLLPGNEVTSGDAMPIPESLPEPEKTLEAIDLLALLSDANSALGVSIGTSWQSDQEKTRQVLSPWYRYPKSKLSLVTSKNEGVTASAATVLIEQGLVCLEETEFVGKRYSYPTKLPVSEELGTVLGQYLAEGHAAGNFLLFSTRESDVQTELGSCLESCGIPYYRRDDGDFVVGTKLWRDIFYALMNSGSANKVLPNFWPSLSNAVLSKLLRGYFEGDGGIDGGSITAVTKSQVLATDLAEALLRFGIWARVAEVRKRKPNGEYGNYFKLTISGEESLIRYRNSIGFISARKSSLLADLSRSRNTNVDIVFGVGKRLLQLRLAAGMSQRDVALRCDCGRAMISAIEVGIRNPSRKLFDNICRALSVNDSGLSGLGRLHSSPIANVQEISATSAYVYDFSVAGFETFMTGSGGLFVHNTFVMAQMVQKLQRPTLVLAHNKTLAAQLFAEFREFFPENSVQYFVSYYDYYQPEAYIPRTDTYIEKDSNINEEIEKFRHASTHAILTRRDVIIVASVSCIYGLGSPEIYRQANISLKVGEKTPRNVLTRRLTDIQYERNDIDVKRGSFRIQGDTLTIFPAYEDYQIKISQFGDEVESIHLVNPLTQNKLESVKEIDIFPAKHYLAPEDNQGEIIDFIERDMRAEVADFEQQGKLIEAQRLKQRVTFDMEMLRQTGTCSGIENYSRYFDLRAPGTPPSVLLDYFPDDYLMMIDESHISIPQIGGMYNGDQARKQTLVDYGFRLRAAKDNRPLKFTEFQERMGQTVYVSATPSKYEFEHTHAEEQELRLQRGGTFNLIAEQLIRPTGIVDPEVEIRPSEGQIDDVLKEIRLRMERNERVLVTTLTKRMSEDITEFLIEKGIKVQYLHSDVKTIERSEILQSLRAGIYDVVVGINLLREGLDLPEVSLVVILDADKEGFLRSETAMIQTIGRAARHPDGRVIMYADRITGSMERAIGETDRRRAIQKAYNIEHGIVPQLMMKPIAIALPRTPDEEVEATKAHFRQLPQKEKVFYLEELREQMRQAALNLDFERASQIRDHMKELQE